MSAAELLLDLELRGIHLEAVGERLRYHPRLPLTPELLARLIAHKTEVLAMLRPTPEVAPLPTPTSDAPANLTKAVCRCGSTTWRDVPIHDGHSVRRDCGRCGRFLDFPVWYGKDALHYE